MGKKVRVEFSYTYNGREISYNDWIQTLPQEAQDVFYAAQQNNYKWRQEAIDQGRMIIDENSNYVWINEEEQRKNKQHDPIESAFFTMYLEQNDIIFHQTPVEIDDDEDSNTTDEQ
jgi:hypothetical protein